MNQRIRDVMDDYWKEQSKPKGGIEAAFVDLDKAKQNRVRIIPTYPDMRELTDESKKALRRAGRRRKRRLTKYE